MNEDLRKFSNITNTGYIPTKNYLVESVLLNEWNDIDATIRKAFSEFDELMPLLNEYTALAYTTDFLLEEDATTKLSNKQIQQLFIVIAQARSYKKEQGSLKGYGSSMGTDDINATKDAIKDRVTLKLSELNSALKKAKPVPNSEKIMKKLTNKVKKIQDDDQLIEKQALYITELVAKYPKLTNFAIGALTAAISLVNTPKYDMAIKMLLNISADVMRGKKELPKDKGDERIDEINPLGGLAKGWDTLQSKFGSEDSILSAKQTQVAKENAQLIWDQWEKSSIKSGIQPTVENVATWLSNQELDSDVLETAFKSIGVNDISSYIAADEPLVEPEETLDAIQQWKDDNMYSNKHFSGKMAKQFILDNGVSEEKALEILKRNRVSTKGIKNGKKGGNWSKSSMSAKDQEVILRMIDKFGEKADATSTNTPTDDTSELGDGKLPDGATARMVYHHLIDKYDVKGADANRALQNVGIRKNTLDDPMDDPQIQKVLGAFFGRERNMFEPNMDKEERMATTQKIMKQETGTTVKDVRNAEKAIKSDDYSSYSELSKLGLAIWSARK